MSLTPERVSDSSRSAWSLLTCSSSYSSTLGAGASVPSFTSTTQRSSWFSVASTMRASPSRISLATSKPAVALAWVLLASVLWFCPSSAIATSERQNISSSLYISALALRSLASSVSTLASSGITATASWIIDSSLSSSSSFWCCGVPRGVLATSQGVPYFSVKVTQNFSPPRLNTVGQKHMDRSANP